MRVDELVGIDLGLAIIDCHVPLITRGETCYLTHSYNPCSVPKGENSRRLSLSLGNENRRGHSARQGSTR